MLHTLSIHRHCQASIDEGIVLIAGGITKVPDDKDWLDMQEVDEVYRLDLRSGKTRVLPRGLPIPGDSSRCGIVRRRSGSLALAVVGMGISLDSLLILDLETESWLQDKDLQINYVCMTFKARGNILSCRRSPSQPPHPGRHCGSVLGRPHRRRLRHLRVQARVQRMVGLGIQTQLQWFALLRSSAQMARCR